MTTKFETISIVGLGYIGLPTAAVFASRKFKVIGVDVNEETVNIINRGEIHIIEPDLDMVVHAAVVEGYLRATTKPEQADAFLIAVPTPFKLDNQPDMKYIEAATKSIAKVLKAGDLVVLESTSPVGATEQMSKWLALARPDLTFPHAHGSESDIRIAHCPERVLPGHVLRELIQNDRVIGGMTPKCSEAAADLYKLFVQGECVITDARTAELCKLTENSFRDVNIAFANELSVICDKLNVNVWELTKLANLHPRVNILRPGPGVGGHCIAVDPWFIVSAAPEEARLIRTAREVNDAKPDWVIKKIADAMEGFLKENSDRTLGSVTVACFGLAFKPDIDDLRESAAMKIVQRLAESCANPLLVVEPNIKGVPKHLAHRVELVDEEFALKHADVHVFLVAHRIFSNFITRKFDSRFVVDSCGLLEI